MCKCNKARNFRALFSRLLQLPLCDDGFSSSGLMVSSWGSSLGMLHHLGLVRQALDDGGVLVELDDLEALCHAGRGRRELLGCDRRIDVLQLTRVGEAEALTDFQAVNGLRKFAALAVAGNRLLWDFDVVDDLVLGHFGNSWFCCFCSGF